MQALLSFGDTFSWRLTQTLLHFLWQGAAIGLAAFLLDRLLLRASSATRYRLHLAALIVMACSLPVTFALVDAAGGQRDGGDRAPSTLPLASTSGSSAPDASQIAFAEPFNSPDVGGAAVEVVHQIDGLQGEPAGRSGDVHRRQAAARSEARAVTAIEEPEKIASGAAWLIPYSPFIAASYLLGVLLMTLRLTWALRGVKRLRRASCPLDDSRLLAAVAEQARRIGLRAAPAVAHCREISVPIVIGVVKPLILLPASIASGLAPDQVQALLAHELAHLRRFDPLVNVAQRLIEAALFFHPAVWYVSRRVSIERENASDDLVLSAGFPRLAYADALVRMAELSLSLRQPLCAGAALAASGERPSEFKRRVLRLLGGQAQQSRLAPGGVLLLWIAVAAGLAAPVLVQAWPEPGQSADAARTADDAEHVGRRIDNFMLRDYVGADHSLQEFSDKRLVVVAFLGTECPLSKLYGPRLDKLATEYRDRGVAFVGINSNRQDTPTEIAQYVRSHDIRFPLLKDPGNRVADQFGAIRTPEVFVLDRERTVRYWGAIDDQFGVGYSRPDATERFLVRAIDELLADRPVGRSGAPSVGCRIGRVSRKAPTGNVTYARQVSRILERRCVECHRDGGIAPFALDSYAEVAGWAETIREVVTDERMPPWHANPKYGHFSNDNRMPEGERQLLCQWIDNGAPEGSATDLPQTALFVDGWSLGEPDLAISMPEPFTVPPDGVVSYQYFTVGPGFAEGKWVRASEVRPGVRSVVHHVIVFINAPGSDPILAERGVGFETVGSYVPGAPAMQLEEGVARYIPAGSKLVFQVHYTPDGKAQKDQTRIGLYFADPATVRRTVQTGVAANLDFVIPPNAKAYQVEADTRLSHDTEIHALIPHMHFRGKSFRFTAHYPNGASEILLDVPRFDFNWQHTYRLARPKLLPEGTLLKCVARFDNSASNLSNPDPSIEVKWGEQTWEEMMIGYFEGVYLNQDLALAEPEMTLLGNGNYRAHFAYRPDRPVQRVNLAGTFNEWNNSSHPMLDPDGDGVYALDIELKPGSYRYKFVVDGDYWTHDPASRILTGFFHESFFVAGSESDGKGARQP